MPTDVRIVTATHRDLATLVAEGQFREDLLYRINVIEVRVPPLRERPDDLEALVQYLLDKQGAKLGKHGCSVAPDAMAVLRRHPWPGNVRELENVIERALVLGAGTVIQLAIFLIAFENSPHRTRALPEADVWPTSSANTSFVRCAPLGAIRPLPREYLASIERRSTGS